MMHRDRRNTRELMEDLERLNPVEEPVLERESPEQRRGVGVCGRVLLPLGGVAALAVLIALAFLPGADEERGGGGIIATAVATAGEQPASNVPDGKYAHRTEQWWQRSVPGSVERATPSSLDLEGLDAGPAARGGIREIWLGTDGTGRLGAAASGIGGERSEGASASSSRAAACGAADIVLGVATHESCWYDGSPLGPNPGSGHYLNRPPEFRKALESHQKNVLGYHEYSPEINDLTGDPAAIDKAVGDIVDSEARLTPDLIQIGENQYVSHKPTKSPSPSSKLRATSDLLANPLASPDLRADLFEYAGSLPGVETKEAVTDPLGREGVAISVTEAPVVTEPVLIDNVQDPIREPFDDLIATGYPLDLSGLRFRTDVIFDPETSELLAEQVELLEADDPLIGAWLDRVGAPQVVTYRAFEAIDVVDSVRLDGEG